MMAFCPEHPKWDQNPKFTPLSKMTSIPTPFICGVPPWDSITNSYPWPIFSNFVYFLLGSPTLTMVPEIKIHTLNINCCKDICYFQFLNKTDREQIIDVRNLLWISSSDIFFFFLSLVCGFCCWSCEGTERQKRIEILFWTQILSKISGYSNLTKTL